VLRIADLGGPLLSVAFSPDGKRLAAGIAFKGVRLLDAMSGKSVQNFAGDVTFPFALAFNPDGKQFAVASLVDGHVALWNADGTQMVRTLKGNVGGVLSLAFSPDGKRLVSAAADGRVKVWDLTADPNSIRLAMDKARYPVIWLSPDGRIALTGVREKTVRLWNAATGEPLGRLVHEHEVSNFDFSANGERVALTDTGKTVTVSDVASGKVVGTIRHHTEGELCTALSADGKWFALPARQMGQVEVWDAEKGRKVRTMEGLKERPVSLEFSADGTRLAAGDSDGTVKVWELASGREVCTSALPGFQIRGLRFSPDRTRLALAGGDGTVQIGVAQVRIVEADTGREVWKLSGPPGLFLVPAFSPDGQRLAAGNMDGVIHVWELVRGQEILRLKGHGAPVSGVAFTPDGRRLISSAADRTVRLWDGTPLPED
jgi:WD40 repeat protein